jgi:hypothetical protein
MNYRNAKKLHSGDEVIEKKTNIPFTVKNICGNKTVIAIEAVSKSGQFMVFYHTEVK